MIQRVSCHLSYLHDITISLNIPLVSTLAERATEAQDWCVLCCPRIPSSFFIPYHIKSLEFTYLRHFLGPLITRVAFPAIFSIRLFSWSYESLFFGVNGHVFHGVVFLNQCYEIQKPRLCSEEFQFGMSLRWSLRISDFKTSRGHSHLHSDFIRVVGKTALQI